MIFDPFDDFTPPDFLFRIAQSPEELEGYWQLRRDIFCEEQHVFEGSDRDEIDETAVPIVCVTLIAGMEDTVVGVVRIDERAPGLWHGSRLGVARDFRSIRRMSPGVPHRNHQPVYRGLGAIGAGLIYKAVSTAHALAARSFWLPSSTRTPVSSSASTGSRSASSSSSASATSRCAPI